MAAKGNFIWYFVIVTICYLIFAIQNQWQTTCQTDGYDDVRSIDVFYNYSEGEKWFGEYEIQLEAHQCYIWKTNFQSRYKNIDYSLNVIFKTKNGSTTEQIGFTQSYENALNCIETNQQDKLVREPYQYYRYHPRKQGFKRERTQIEVYYGDYQSCRWPDASGTHFIFLQAGEEGWRGSVAPYRDGEFQCDSGLVRFLIGCISFKYYSMLFWKYLFNSFIINIIVVEVVF